MTNTTKSRLSKVPVTVTVVLGKTRIRYEDLQGLSEGSVVELNKIAGEPLEIYVGDQLFGLGEVVVVNEKFGIRITETTLGDGHD